MDSWRHQVRSYAPDLGWVKDLRTGLERIDVPAVLDGDIDEFLIAATIRRANCDGR